MKPKLPLVLGMLCAVSAPAFAQSTKTTVTPPPRFGILMGPDFVSYSTDGLPTKAQITGGFLYEQYFMPQFSAQPELRYTNKSVGAGDYNMLTIPIMLKGHVPTGTVISPNLAAGPDFSVKLSGSDPLKTFLFAMDFGAGLDAEVTPTTSLSFDFRYSLGLLNALSSIDSKPREVSLLFGMKLSL